MHERWQLGGDRERCCRTLVWLLTAGVSLAAFLGCGHSGASGGVAAGGGGSAGDATGGGGSGNDAGTGGNGGLAQGGQAQGGQAQGGQAQGGQAQGNGGANDAGAPQPNSDGGSFFPPDESATATKVDLLLMIDNSASMSDKQAILQAAIPDLVGHLVNPVCVDSMGIPNQAATDMLQPQDACPVGLVREFAPILDLHIGVITSSLGGFGATSNACKNVGPQTQKEDMARLLGSLPRGQTALIGESNVNAAGLGFLEWTGTNRPGLESAFSKLIGVTGERGCGYEASLEAWYRFLVDPEPYASLVPSSCQAGGTDTNCRTRSGTDTAVLMQRAAFLRPDSLVAVMMLTDENDCSVKAGGQAWYVADPTSPLWRASSICETDPNNACCYSCGQAPPTACAADPACGDPLNTVEPGDYYLDAMGRKDYIKDPDNLRCFHQKQRFGVDFLYPTERYANALTQRDLCVTRNDLSAGKCGPSGRIVPNPLFQVPAGSSFLPRDTSLVFLAGIVGVPWQDIVVNPDPGMPITATAPLKYQTYEQMLASNTWSVILGDGFNPGDPLMIEQVSARSGQSPIVNEPLAPVTAGYMANSVNGHEWSPTEDLQYACIFPLQTPRDCSLLTAETDPQCDCQGPSATADAQSSKPLCQDATGAYGFVQNYAKAYPGIRELEVINKFGTFLPKNALVASICARNVSDATAEDYGYRPAMDALIEKMAPHLISAP